MERYDIEKNQWIQLRHRLEEGRYHATATIQGGRYIYIFGGYKTESFYGKVAYKVSRKHEKIQNVRSDYIEVYDTHEDQALFDIEDRDLDKRPIFRQIHLQRDNINNVGNLICFPLYDLSTRKESQDEILITGGLFVGIIDVKGHVFNTQSHKINVRKDLALPYPDISKFYYQNSKDKVYVVGRYRVLEFDLWSNKWRTCG